MAKVSLESARAFVAILGAVKDRWVSELSKLVAAESHDNLAIAKAKYQYDEAFAAFFQATQIVNKAVAAGLTEFDHTILDIGNDQT